MIAVITEAQIIFFSLSILVVVILTVIFTFSGYRLINRPPSNSPYVKIPLRKGSDLPSDSIEKILRYLYHLHQYDNRMFDLNKAAYCRETGRVFPNAVNWYGQIKVDWTFLQKRFPGTYVSWGSLSLQQQLYIREQHDVIEGYNTRISSPNPSPRQIELEYALAKPGPLYVDLETNILLGWKNVPDTMFEVLIVQKPKNFVDLI